MQVPTPSPPMVPPQTTKPRTECPVQVRMICYPPHPHVSYLVLVLVLPALTASPTRARGWRMLHCEDQSLILSTYYD